MILYIKKHFKNINPCIDEWDEPREREFNGSIVKGRPTKGFGSSSFDYAGKLYKPIPWTPPMYKIKQMAEQLVWEELGIDKQFTFCLCGYYGVEGKGIPHHSDTVPTLDDIVVSISLGEPRVFVQRTYQNPIKKHTNTSELNDVNKENFLINEQFFVLEHGDVLIFDGHNQMNSTHCVPDLQAAKERINLTFRSGL
jgi:alkylated DNA repair dioxygenase AlkB|tara:strand:+ start:2949 stop:3536 length:588 start_codon:yes stop_codon:yes gene_type:complete